MSESCIERVRGFRNVDMQQHVGRKSSKLDEKCRRSPDARTEVRTDRETWSALVAHQSGEVIT